MSLSVSGEFCHVGDIVFMSFHLFIYSDLKNSRVQFSSQRTDWIVKSVC